MGRDRYQPDEWKRLPELRPQDRNMSLGVKFHSLGLQAK
jgi:hypothetical protein